MEVARLSRIITSLDAFLAERYLADRATREEIGSRLNDLREDLKNAKAPRTPSKYFGTIGVQPGL